MRRLALLALVPVAAACTESRARQVEHTYTVTEHGKTRTWSTDGPEHIRAAERFVWAKARGENADGLVWSAAPVELRRRWNADPLPEGRTLQQLLKPDVSVAGFGGQPEAADAHGMVLVIETDSKRSVHGGEKGADAVAFVGVDFTAVLDDGSEHDWRVIVRPVGETWKVVPPL